MKGQVFFHEKEVLIKTLIKIYFLWKKVKEYRLHIVYFVYELVEWN